VHKRLIHSLFLNHGDALQGFFRRRIRSKAEAADLTQEVYLRMLRVKESQAIHNLEGYMYAVAVNLLKEQRVLEQRQFACAHDSALDADIQFADLPAFDSDLDVESRKKRLLEVLQQLPPNCRAAILLQYRDGLSYQEIAQHLCVSTHTVKKYLAQALAHCRKRMARWG